MNSEKAGSRVIRLALLVAVLDVVLAVQLTGGDPDPLRVSLTLAVVAVVLVVRASDVAVWEMTPAPGSRPRTEQTTARLRR